VCEKPYTRAELENLIKSLLDITELPFLIKRQIRDYTERGWTYKGIARAICFMIDERNFNLRASYKQYGIGIITSNNGEPYVSAQQFYEKLRQEKEKQAQRQQEIIKATNAPSVIIKCGRADESKKIKKNKIDISQL
jgi:hypothetical protein